MITVTAYRYRKGDLDQTTWSTNMGIPKRHERHRIWSSGLEASNSGGGVEEGKR